MKKLMIILAGLSVALTAMAGGNAPVAATDNDSIFDFYDLYPQMLLHEQDADGTEVFRFRADVAAEFAVDTTLTVYDFSGSTAAGDIFKRFFRLADSYAAGHSFEFVIDRLDASETLLSFSSVKFGFIERMASCLRDGRTQGCVLGNGDRGPRFVFVNSGETAGSGLIGRYLSDTGKKVRVIVEPTRGSFYDGLRDTDEYDLMVGDYGNGLLSVEYMRFGGFCNIRNNKLLFMPEAADDGSGVKNAVRAFIESLLPANKLVSVYRLRDKCAVGVLAADFSEIVSDYTSFRSGTMLLLNTGDGESAVSVCFPVEKDPNLGRYVSEGLLRGCVIAGDNDNEPVVLFLASNYDDAELDSVLTLTDRKLILDGSPAGGSLPGEDMKSDPAYMFFRINADGGLYDRRFSFGGDYGVYRDCFELNAIRVSSEAERKEHSRIVRFILYLLGTQSASCRK